jgi:hypothetical protein
MLFDGRRLIGYRAVEKDEAKNNFKSFEKKENNAPKDKRNLYLLRASLIRKGTSQEKGMSDEDAKLREKLCLMAKKKLSNMITFVSPTRLSVIVEIFEQKKIFSSDSQYSFQIYG